MNAKQSSKTMYRKAIILIIINLISEDAFPLPFFLVSGIKDSGLWWHYTAMTGTQLQKLTRI